MNSEDFDRKTISALVQRLRQSRGISIKRFAKESNLSRAMISKIEAGKTTPTVTTLRKLAKGMGMTLGEVVAGLDDEPLFFKTSLSEVERRLSNDKAFESFPINVRGHDRKNELFWFRFLKAGQHDAIRPPGTIVSIFVQRGEMIVSARGHEIELRAGEFTEFQPGKHYVYIQRGKRMAEGFVSLRYA